jgi:two-component system, LytTR family, response regulator
MRAVIVDDEPIARRVLREQLEIAADVEIVGEASSGPEALAQIIQLEPDLVFLDLEMPELDGFSVLRSLKPETIPLIIFVTAYNQHALEAFNVGALDYLLKPVREERLSAALQKARSQLMGKRNAAPRKVHVHTRRIVGKLGSDLHLLQPSEVVAFEARGEIVHIVTASRRYESTHSLKTLEQKLDHPQFRRVHRKTIINTDHIRRISPLSSKRWLLILSNGMEVIVSKRLAGAIRDETKW